MHAHTKWRQIQQTRITQQVP